MLHDRGGRLLNEKAVWRTKSGQLLDLLLTYTQVAYRGGHISFVGGKRVLWVYDVTALTRQELRVVEQERQLREILDYCPAAVCVVDEEGGFFSTTGECATCSATRKQELDLFDTKLFWHDLGHRERIIELLRARGGQLLNEEVIWKNKQGELLDLLISYVQVAYARRPRRCVRWQAAVLALRHNTAASRGTGAAAQRTSPCRSD